QECHRARARNCSVARLATAGETQACAYCAGEMGREVRLARRRQASPYPPLTHRVVRAVVTYLAVVLTIAALLQAFTSFPALTWLGKAARMLVVGAEVLSDGKEGAVSQEMALFGPKRLV